MLIKRSTREVQVPIKLQSEIRKEVKMTCEDRVSLNHSLEVLVGITAQITILKQGRLPENLNLS